MASTNVQIDVLDINRKVVQSLINEEQNIGKQGVLNDFSKKSLPNGIYFIRMKLDNQLIIKRILVNKK